jgi:predicted metal-dependent hydrolase
MVNSINLDGLTFEIIRSSERKSMEIIVERDGGLIVRIPEQCSEEEVMAFVESKLIWVFNKLGERDLFQRPVGEKEIVNGEGFFFLGDSFRLIIDNSQVPSLTWDGEYFRLKSDQVENGRKEFISWYTEQGKQWLEERVLSTQRNFLVEVNDVRVLDLGNRWGSCSRDGSINLHWRVMLLPPRIIDYVIHHELAHILHPNHSDEYWGVLETALPDYRERKKWLAENGGMYFL